MSNDDLFDNNEILLDDDDIVINDNEEFKSDSEEVGVSTHLKDELSQLAAQIRDDLGNVQSFSFGFYSSMFNGLIRISNNYHQGLSDRSHGAYLAPLKNPVDFDGNAIATSQLAYLIDMQAYIMKVGTHARVIRSLINVFSDSVEGEPEHSFVLFFYNALIKENKLIDLYLAQLLHNYEAYCANIGVEPDSNLVEYQIKSAMDRQDRIAYGYDVPAFHYDGIGENPDALENEDKGIALFANAVFNFVNKLQVALDKVRKDYV